MPKGNKSGIWGDEVSREMRRKKSRYAQNKAPSKAVPRPELLEAKTGEFGTRHILVESFLKVNDLHLSPLF